VVVMSIDGWGMGVSRSCPYVGGAEWGVQGNSPPWACSACLVGTVTGHAVSDRGFALVNVLCALLACAVALCCCACRVVPDCCCAAAAAAGFMLPNPDDAVIWRGPRWAVVLSGPELTAAECGGMHPPNITSSHLPYLRCACRCCC
jgi:hypothetical protein